MTTNNPFTTTDRTCLPTDGVWRHVRGRVITTRGGQTFVDGHLAEGLVSREEGDWEEYWQFVAGWPVSHGWRNSTMCCLAVFDPPGRVAKETTEFLDRDETVVRTFGAPPLASKPAAAPPVGPQ